ncbi:hypothetical protein AB6806_27410 [Bosea sp. RCC_152_1]|uniref:hypothetical protein n=1 Tax=Bosea sp. RCC_152_1 TaxID=3239228 RepID=UPI003523EDF3
MRLFLPCPTCAKDSDGTAYGLPFSESNIYSFRCHRGHEITVGLVAVRFEVLFEIGMQALVDGYYREAVMTFSTALERFYEFYVRLIWEARGIDAATRKDLWGQVAKQSERQLGLFAATFLLDTGQMPPLLPQTMVSLRNDLVHKGDITDQASATTFGQVVADLVHPALHEAVGKHKEAAATMHRQHCENVLAAHGRRPADFAWWAEAFPVSRVRADKDPINVAAEVQRRVRRDRGEKPQPI